MVVGTKPKDVIRKASEDLLIRFANVPLLDRYEVYQQLMSYWDNTMQDDVYQIVQEGWQRAPQIRLIVDKSDKSIKEAPDIIIGSGKNAKKFKTELIPTHLIVNRYYDKEKKDIEEREIERENYAQKLEELIDKYSGEDGLIEDVLNEKGKLTKNSLKIRINEINDNKEFSDELMLLKQCLELIHEENCLLVAIKQKQSDLDKKIIAHYSKLTEDEIKHLVVNDKWYATLESQILSEAASVAQTLAKRVKQLDDRYAIPLSQLSDKVDKYSLKVEQHLKKMGLSW